MWAMDGALAIFKALINKKSQNIENKMRFSMFFWKTKAMKASLQTMIKEKKNALAVEKVMNN